jgi:ribosomal protein S21
MLPDFPELKAELSKFIFEFLAQRVYLHLGALSEIRRHTVFEGPQEDSQGQQLVRHTGEVENSGLKLMSAEISVSSNEFPKMTLDQVLSKADEIAQKLASQMAKHAYQRISETLEGTGNTVDAKGKKLSAELILELFSTVQIDFDRNGNPKMPKFHIHPKLAETLSLAINELENNRELKRELNQILVNKKEEWREREAYRKLVG